MLKSVQIARDTRLCFSDSYTGLRVSWETLLVLPTFKDQTVFNLCRPMLIPTSNINAIRIRSIDLLDALAKEFIAVLN